MPFLDSSRYLWRVWKASTRASLTREMQFRANFIAGLVRQAVWLGAFIFMVKVIFQNTQQLAGWQQHEVLIIIALSRFLEGIINSLFAQNLMELPELVQQGKFDFFLIKPVPVQFYTAFRQTGIDNIGNIGAGLILLFYTLITHHIMPSPGTFLLFFLLSALGVSMYYSLIAIAASLVFFLERLEFLWGFHILMSEPLTTPLDIFPRIPRTIMTYILPIAFVTFVPAQALTGRLHWWQMPLAIGLAAIFLFLSNVAWRAGLRRYSSASS